MRLIDKISVPLRIFMICSLLAVFVGGCATYGGVVIEPQGGTVEGAPPPGRHESAQPKIPPGHMPPPGKCRIWLPDTPPGHQPPPGDCEELRHRVPPGAWLIRG